MDAPGTTVTDALTAATSALGATSDSPHLDAQVLMADLLGVERSSILAHPEQILERDQLSTFLTRIDRCRRGAALPYVLGWWEFYGRRFRVSPDVLIPRPETELLVERAMHMLAAMPGRRRVVDVGTGSGCIAVSLAAGSERASLWATDISRPALRVANDNAIRLVPDHPITLVQADLLSGLRGPFDLICANLPYVPTLQLQGLPVGAREPWVALDGGQDGLVVIRRLLSQLPSALALGGRALLEIESGMGPEVSRAARQLLPSARLHIERDLSGADRLLVVQIEG